MLHLFSETNTKVTIIIHKKRHCVNAAYINSERFSGYTLCSTYLLISRSDMMAVWVQKRPRCPRIRRVPGLHLPLVC